MGFLTMHIQVLAAQASDAPRMANLLELYLHVSVNSCRALLVKMGVSAIPISWHTGRSANAFPFSSESMLHWRGLRWCGKGRSFQGLQMSWTYRHVPRRCPIRISCCP